MQRHEDRSQEGENNFLSVLEHFQCLTDEMKARSPEKFMDASDVKVTEENGFLSRTLMIKAKNIIMKERIWINHVARRRPFVT